MTAKRLASKAIWIGAASVVFWSGIGGTASAGWVPAVPELDPGSLASGLALLLGGGALIFERYRRR